MSEAIVGVVTDIIGRNVAVHAADEPRTHLRDLIVPRPSPPSKLSDLKVGDRVKMQYFSTRSYGLWSITEIL